jgi:AraC-like DNA-binding protein
MYTRLGLCAPLARAGKLVSVQRPPAQRIRMTSGAIGIAGSGPRVDVEVRFLTKYNKTLTVERPGAEDGSRKAEQKDASCSPFLVKIDRLTCCSNLCSSSIPSSSSDRPAREQRSARQGRGASSMVNEVSVPHGIRLVRPPPALQPFVRYYAHRSARLADTVVAHPVHARAASILDFEFGDVDGILYVPSGGKPPILSPRSILIGVQTCRQGELHISGTVDSFDILFQPDGLNLLFALPADEFTDQSFDAESVFGPVIARFQEQLADCRSFEERVSAANQFLIRRSRAVSARDGVTVAAHQILSEAGAGRIPVMADRAGLSMKQFRRRFVQKVGVNPKLFSRIARFEAALDRMARSPGGHGRKLHIGLVTTTRCIWFTNSLNSPATPRPGRCISLKRRSSGRR